MTNITPSTMQYLWVAPLSLVGLLGAAASRGSGGRVVMRDGIVEATGGVMSRVLPRLGLGVTPAAMAIGHVIIAIDDDILDAMRPHELVHVRQAERWGPLFPLAYAAAALVAMARGKHGYRDNAFEVEARGAGRGAR